MLRSRWLSCLLGSVALCATAQAEEKAAPPIEPAPVVIPAAPVVIPAAVVVEEGAHDPLRPRISVRHDIGDGVGYDNGFTYVQGWIPLFQQAGRSVLFADLRAINYDNADFWEYNAGGGYRWYDECRDRIFGVNAYYDGRDTEANFFHQAGIGVETLGKYVDFRANGYMVLGPSRQLVSDGGFSNPTFRGFNIVFDHSRVFDNAYSGIDTEVGTPIPGLCRWDARAFAGYYHYEGEQGPEVNGVRGRLEAQVNQNVSLHFAVQNDAVFDTTISGGIALHLGGRKVDRAHRTVADRLDARVVRDVNIVINQTKEVTKELAINPKTGQPFIVKHANSAAAAGGDGTVENPFRTLTQLQAGSAPNDILFLHANSTFTQQLLTLKNGQRLLGEGIDHFFTAAQGTFLLPRATTGTNLPLLLRTGGATNTITLAMDNEVSGLRYQRTGGTGGFIFGTGNVGTFDINRNVATGGPFDVSLTNVTGNGIISGNTFTTGNVSSGIILTEASGNVRLLIEKNQINVGNVASGILVTQTGASNVVLGIRDNRFTSGAAAASVTDLAIGGGASQLLLLRNNVGTGGYILTSAGALFRVENTLGTNSPAPTAVGTTIVAPGATGF